MTKSNDHGQKRQSECASVQIKEIALAQKFTVKALAEKLKLSVPTIRKHLGDPLLMNKYESESMARLLRIPYAVMDEILRGQKVKLNIETVVSVKE